MITNRREFLKMAGIGLAGLQIGSTFSYLRAATEPGVVDVPLAEQVATVCRRLAPHGWRDLFLKLTGGELDLSSPTLAQDLEKPLSKIDRTLPGFEDFAEEGGRAIEPGSPARSLLFHALASANVVEDGAGKPLADFPTIAELDAVENCVYGLRAPSLDELRTRAGGAQLALVVFAREYRSAPNTVHRKHADLCFARTALTRSGNLPALYDGRRRDFVPLDPDNKFAFRVLPTRFAAYIAVRQKGDASSFGPLRHRKDDGDRDFWVPVHKLFVGSECVRGLRLDLDFQAHFINEKLRKLHQFMETGGFGANSTEAERDQFPFVIRDATLAAFATEPAYGPGLISPKPNPIFAKAEFGGKPLGFEVSSKFTGVADNVWFSTLQIVADAEADSPFNDGVGYMASLNPTVGRITPEYINARHQLLPDGSVKDLNQEPKLMDILRAGGYRAQHYIDYTGDGWVAASCPQLAAELGAPIAAYVGIAPPDFFPAISQGQLIDWWQREAPEVIRQSLWCVEPLALSDRRMAANVTLPAGFNIHDDSVTAIVSHPATGKVAQRPTPVADAGFHTRLPDGANGVFDPGWDFSQDTAKTPIGNKLHLANYGLGTPFIEDAKLCAALGSFWPAVAPDATRVFEPGKKGQGSYWPWPAVVPLTDEEIGTAPTADGTFLAWDGVPGPERVMHMGKPMMRHSAIAHVDYINLEGKLTAALTGKIDMAEYTSRILALVSTYWALGIRQEKFLKPENWKVGVDHSDAFTPAYTKELALNRLNLEKAKWAVASFRKVLASDAGLVAALAATHTTPTAGSWYRISIYRYGKQITDPADFRRVLIEIHDPFTFYVNRETVLFQPEDKPWEKQTPLATS